MLIDLLLPCYPKMMRFALFLVLYSSLFLIHPSIGFKILGIFPLPGQSHINYNNAIMKSLMDSGHEVTIFTPFPEQASTENYSSIIDVSEKNLSYVGQATFDEFITQNPFKVFEEEIETELLLCSKVINSPEMQKILNSDEKLYDVVFVETLFIYQCYLPVAEKMKIPFIGTLSLRSWVWADHAIHNPNHPAYISFEAVTQKWKLEHIFGRIINVFNHIVLLWYRNFVGPKLLKQFHNDHIDQLKSLGKYLNMEPELIFYNNHASLLPRPMNPNAIEIGGIHMKEADPLPENIKKFIDEAEHGVILFTLGSVVRAATLTLQIQEAFRNAFAEIPQRVIWKFEEKMENLSSNVMLLEWLPQRDILEHEKVIAFISHCGLGSTNEAVYTATPVVAFPLFSDQIDNAVSLEDLGAAVHLDIYDITKENVLNALNAIINDTRYYNNIQKLSKTFKDRPMSPQQSVVYWTEYVIRHQGASHLRSPASQLYWYQFLMLDVIFVVAAVLVIFIYSLSRIFRILSCCFLHLNFFNNVLDKPKNKKL